ncbi:replication-associated recombination protein A [Clostridiaceae bacterium UIB06]|uniref:Replication-associated recombination protein A n=1 Tax=Clostridium thailandense TaxID=2794346 RepID=A0A949TFK2_9CLOT|nr:replication-associated recombination protein A [Clostridium thailandense]MBV7271884.1 replication-associated recombination protein A [Clostridium thailandense]MCH5137110.1 replication-associated recombination protein A [Clostridiaceae bacterium UIB06]
MKPLADKIRPSCMSEIVGQHHLVGEGKILNKIIETKQIPNMIFYGPPGVGKTTVANIIASVANKRFYKLNATNASVGDIKKIIDELDNLLSINGVLLYLDEIQNFNKKQQQSLLEYTENGQITLIASTTENPYFYIYNALLSRSSVFEFKPLNKNDIIKALKRGIDVLEKELKSTKILCEESILEYFAENSGGDLRKAINNLQLTIYTANRNSDGNIEVTMELAKECSGTKALNYDKLGDKHYDVLSAFQKSIRGSDPDAAIHYLARLIKAGDLISICRRLLVIAAEDIGVAYPSAISIVKACVDSAMQLGFPEARIPLAEAVIVLATAPKSNSAISAIDKALSDLDNLNVGEVPEDLKDAHYGGAQKLNRGLGYKYPHNYENHYVKQQYLPDNIKDALYYIPGNNKMENSAKAYMNFLKESSK